MRGQKDGFTLIELIIVLTIFVCVFEVAFLSLGQLRRSWTIAAQQQAKSQILFAVAERITADIRSASVVLDGSSSQEVGLMAGSDVIRYRLAAQKVRREKNGSAAYLTDEGEITRLVFSYPSPYSIVFDIGEINFHVSIRN